MDKYTQDGEDITCKCCGLTAREFFEEIMKEAPQSNWFAGNTWYCSEECYNEATIDEG